MSEPKLISPMLDGYVMGDAISSHDGVRCCPAMQMETESKYIVKIISIPASQKKLDALLLTGAFSSADSADAYFKDLADGVVSETLLLQRLSQLEGFCAYEDWQLEPMDENETGYDVYLLGAYRPTLERLLQKNTLTHLAAVNLGLDLCSALSVSRRSGYLYVDLRPENVYIVDEREFRIGDLGFIKLDSLEFASMPDRYISAYTAPEIADAYSALNTTLDVYAVGMILYQAYNDGMLPFEGRASDAPLSAPKYADPEMAQIILKACDPNPEVRWQDPAQMGQALVTYMQTNSINDTPIIAPAAPVMPEILAEEPVEEDIPAEPTTDDLLAVVDQALEDAGVDVTAQEAPVEEDVPAQEETPAEDIPVEEEIPTEEVTGEETPAEETTGEEESPAEDTTEEETPAEEITEEEAPAEEAPAQTEATALQEELGVTDEVFQMLSQADDLIAHETPEQVEVPEHVEVPIPQPVIEQPEEELPGQLPEEEYEEEPFEEELPVQKPKKRKKGLIAALIALLLLGAIAIGCWLFYNHYYLQTILGITVNGTEDRLTVSLNTEIDDELLTVYCTDTYGNTLRAEVTNGQANFWNLNANTRYSITVKIDGFHQLIGTTSAVHMTPQQTSILDFNAITGMEDGSVILSFTVNGPQTGEWKVIYTAEGEEPKEVVFSEQMVTVNGLTVGKEYTFKLEPTSDLYMVGENTLKHTASKIIYAQDLTIHGFYDQDMKVTWKAPEGVTVNSWTVTCYSDKGYSKTFTTTDLQAVFEDLDLTAAYTVEVSAEGMVQKVRTYVLANSVTVSNMAIDDTDPTELIVTWDYEGTAPEGGWLLLYTIDGSEEQLVIRSEEPRCIITPVIPGSHYEISVQPANGSTVFGGTAEYEAPAAAAFSGYGLLAENFIFSICKAPENPNWGRYDIPEEDYTNIFTKDDKIGFAVNINDFYDPSDDLIITMFIVRDAEGNLVSSATSTALWRNMWFQGFGRFMLPLVPAETGAYTVDIYFNGAYVTTQSFTITEPVTQ